MATPNPIRRFPPFLLLLACALALPAAARAQMTVGLEVTVAPPPLPVYGEPPLPADGYVFIPGYWAWGPGGYYWVPGTWVLPPGPGLLWTPGYWAVAADGGYVWQAGYWGPSVGFYGGIDYGFGYYGTGYYGGYWDHDVFFYNSEVHNFGHARVEHVYGREVPDARGQGPHRSFNGAARGGVDAHPGPDETRAASEPHMPPHDLQVQHENQAATIRTAPATVNHGRPPVAATPHPATFTGHGIVSARPPTPPPHPQAPHPAAAQGQGGPPQGHGGPPQGQGGPQQGQGGPQQGQGGPQQGQGGPEHH